MCKTDVGFGYCTLSSTPPYQMDRCDELEDQKCDLGNKCPSKYSYYTEQGDTCMCKTDVGFGYCTLSSTPPYQMDRCDEVEVVNVMGVAGDGKNCHTICSENGGMRCS